MVQIYPSMSLKIFGNAIKLICHDLEYTEFLTEFRRTCSRVVQTIPTAQKLSQKVWAYFCVRSLDHWSGGSYKSLHSQWHGIFHEFFGESWKWFQTVPISPKLPLYEFDDLKKRKSADCVILAKLNFKNPGTHMNHLEQLGIIPRKIPSFQEFHCYVKPRPDDPQSNTELSSDIRE